MSRADALGLFWQDVTKIKVKKPPPEKKTPPPRTWEEPGYLPEIDEPQILIPAMSDELLYTAAYDGSKFVFDCEVYPNYFSVGFKIIGKPQVLLFEKSDEFGLEFDPDKLRWVLQTVCLVGFNSKSYDIPVLCVALERDNKRIKEASDLVVTANLRPYEILKAAKVRGLGDLNHIDLIEVAPLRASLKTYAGRFHARRMQDLPFPPHAVLTLPQIEVTRWYNINDLDNTEGLYNHLKEQIDLRDLMGQQYSKDLRSKSDAQIAEAVIADQIEQQIGGKVNDPPMYPPGTRFEYKDPGYLDYRSELMKWVKQRVLDSLFIVGESGAIGMPDLLKDLEIKIADSTYRMGIGGLHSSEECVAHYADANFCIVDRDVVSYYPQIILNQRLYPEHLGPVFLDVFRDIVSRRIAYKKAGDKAAADTLKIVINGTFGKLSNKYSDVYSPNLGIQVTVSGQLTLLLLIERLEMAGIQVISANTDGVTIKCLHSKREQMNQIIAEWEKTTGFETEEVEYLALYSRDVNNYIAVKKEGGVKLKGAFANPWADPKQHSFELHKNPQNTICIEAAVLWLTEKIPLSHTVRSCTDIRKFVTVRHVSGGAVKNGRYFGKQIRWYYAVGVEGAIIYAKSGNNVPRSEGAKPLMILPESMPLDVDYDWYIKEAESILQQVGAIPKESKKKLAKS